MEILKKTGKISKLVVAAVVLLSFSAYAQQVNLISHVKTNPNGSQMLLNHVPSEVALGLAAKISPVNSNQMLDLRIILPSKDQAGLDSFIKELYDPKSPNYHKFLNPQQFDLQFGASTVDSAIVIEQLKSQGFTIESQSKNGFILTVTGPVSKVESVFKVNINNYKKTDGTIFFAPDANPTIMPQIAGKIYAIVGMDNATKYYSHSHQVNSSGAGNVQVPLTGGNLPVAIALPPAAMRLNVSSVPNKIVSSQPAKAVSPEFSGSNNSIIPSDIRIAYNLNSVASTGSGQTLALYELDGYLAGDITNYENAFSIPHATLTNICTDQSCPEAAGPGQTEVVLDIDVALAVSPGISILVYEAPNTDAGRTDQWNRIASDDLAKSISTSWGLFEGGVDAYNHNIFQQLASQGQAVFAAAGDEGAYDNCANDSVPPSCAGQELIVDDPASDPNITGVGISKLTINGNGTYNSETASLNGGGGISGVWSIPSYQTTAAAGASHAAMVSTTMRNVPDVAFTADPATDYLIFVDGGWNRFWGSSAASPIWASFLTRVNQGRVAWGGVGNVIGFLNPTIYQIAQSSDYTTDFHDITSGNNSFYPAETGFDDAIGLGSFNGANLYNELMGPAAPGGLTPTPSNAQIALNWTASSGAVSYNVKRSTSHGGPYTTISTSGTVTSTNYTDSAVINGTPYYYVVSGVNAGEVDGANSSEVNSIPLAPTPPTAPSSVSAVSGPFLDATATVTFSGALADGSPITGYTVTSNPGGLTNTGTSPVTISGLTDGVSYTFTVTATNAIGTSPASSASNSVISGVPAPPTTVTAVSGNTAATVNFSGALPLGSAITGYTVTSSPAGGLTNTGVSSPITVTGLTNGVSYTFTVTATNSFGTSAASVVSNSVIPAGPPFPPTTVISAPGNNSATVSFSGALPNGSTITGYTATSSPGGFTGAAPSSPITVSGLTNGVSYTFAVTATNTPGTGAASSPSSPIIAGSPLPPTTVTGVSGNTQVIVTFSGATANGGPITLYTVTSSPAGGLTNTGASSPITVTGLTNEIPYTFTVTATNSFGTSAASVPSGIITPTAVKSPTNLKATILGARVGGRIIYGGVSLTWVQSASPIVQNKIYRSTGAGMPVYLATISASTSYKDTNVVNGTSYNYVVTALNSTHAESNFSNQITINY